jgi:hypothetical protein
VFQSNALANFIVNLFTQKGFSSLINVLVIIIEILYVIFTLIVVRQVNLLNRSFKTDAGGIFIIFSYLHLLFAIGLVLISLLTL